MNYPEMVSLVVCAVFVTSCESTDTVGSNRAEKRELANRAAAQQQQTQVDESQQNLSNAQKNTLNQDGNPMRGN
jgi:hypothetical protein